MSDPLKYEKPALLDRIKHRRTRVRPGAGFAFARNSNSLYVAAAEFNEAAKEYAIVFTRTGTAGTPVPVLMLGMKDRENLFVGDTDRWDARYIPAFVRRYPFVLAQAPQQQLAVCIDEACPGVTETEGEALFDAQGQETPYLKNTLQFLNEYQREYARTEAFCKRLDEAGLLTEMNARADLRDGTSFVVNGMLIVDEKKLLALPDATVLSLFRSGELHLVSLHLASLSNMQRLLDRMAQRHTPAKPAPAAG
jgi:hypothetical protein